MWKTIFKVLDKNPRVYDEDVEKISSFIFVKWLANNPKTVLASNQINLYYNMPMKNQFKLINDTLGGKNVYVQYPKKQKHNEQLYDAFVWYYTIGKDAVEDYIQHTSREQQNEIIDLYNEYKLQQGT